MAALLPPTLESLTQSPPMNISSLLSPDAPRGRIVAHRSPEHTGPELYSSTPSDVPIQAPSPIHPLNQAALWENGGYDVESVEKAMSKSSSSSSGMGGHYDPIHDKDQDQEPLPITMPVLSPGGRGLSIGGYDPVHSSIESRSSHSMRAPSQYRSSTKVAPLAPPPIPQPHPSRAPHPVSPPPLQYHHQQKASYPNVLNELTTTDSYSPRRYYAPESEATQPERIHYDPVGEAVSHQSADSMQDVSRNIHHKRVWEDESYTSHQHGGSYPLPDPEVEHRSPEPEPMDEEEDPQTAYVEQPPEDGGRIQELRIMLEKYPLYKPGHLELISLLRSKYQRLGTDKAHQELESARSFTNETMQLGEQGWIEWIKDEDKACSGLEGRMRIIELCSKAVEEQPMSVALWRIYVDQLESQYRLGLGSGKQNGNFTAEEQEINEGIAEIFTQDMLFGVYAQAVEATKNNLPEVSISRFLFRFFCTKLIMRRRGRATCCGIGIWSYCQRILNSNAGRSHTHFGSSRLGFVADSYAR